MGVAAGRRLGDRLQRLHGAAAPAWNDNPVWTADPKVTPFRDVLKYARDVGYSGSLGYASAAVMGDFVLRRHVRRGQQRRQDPKAAAERRRRARQALLQDLTAKAEDGERRGTRARADYAAERGAGV